MRVASALAFFLWSSFLVAQTAMQPLGVTSPQFLAVSVRDLDAASKWYTEALALTASRDMPSAPGAGSRTRVLSSDEFVVELSEHADAKSIREYTSVPTPTFLVHGFFKAGVFVTDLDRAVATLKARGVVGVGETQSDPSLGLRWVLLRDNGGNFIQVLERRRP